MAADQPPTDGAPLLSPSEPDAPEPQPAAVAVEEPADPPPAAIAAEESVAAPTIEARRHVDLTLGAWRPREAAVQLATTLGIALGPGLPSDPATSPITIGRRGIDVGAVGDPIAFLAHDDARRIAAALPAAATIVVLAPRHGRGIGTLNDWLFHFLRQLALSLVVIGDEPATAMARSAFERRRGIDPPQASKAIAEFSPEQQRLLRFFPGLLPRTIADRLGLDAAAASLVPVGASHFLIPPGYRDTDPAAAAPALDAMEDIEGLDGGLKALAQTFCTAHFADSAALGALASSAFHAGEIDLARELAARARNVARDPALAAAADLIRQDIRLYQRRFTEILATPEPSRRAPQSLRAGLATVRLRAGLERAERNSVPAGLDAVVSRLNAGGADPDDVHLLSLHVAARIAAGEGAGVAALAEQVATAASKTGDERLIFLAAINQAALARGSGDGAAGRRALARALATSDGTRSLAEIVAMNALLARAEDDPASTAARNAWLRAGLAWLAFEPVEAFPASSVDALLGTASVPRTQLDQSVSEAIASALEKGSPGLAGAVDGSAPLPVVRAASRSEVAATRLVGGPGAAVLWSPRRIEDAPASAARLRLVGLAWAALREACPAANGSESGTILIDGDAGSDLPATRDAAMSVALRAGVPEVLYGAERIAIDAAARPRMVTELRVGLSPAVASVDGPADAPLVRFRRHLSETTLRGREAEVLVLIRDRGRMTLGSLAVLIGIPIADTEALLRALETRGIVRVEFEAR